MSSEKITGWCAWHPEGGVTVLCLSKTACEHKLSGVKHENYQRYEEFSRAHEEQLYKALEDGWKIRPVEIVFTDEPKPDAVLKESEWAMRAMRPDPIFTDEGEK